jgi:CXXX repeat peptide maturase
MNDRVLDESLKFCRENGFEPVLLGGGGDGDRSGALAICNARSPAAASAAIAVYDNDVVTHAGRHQASILLVDRAHLAELSRLVGNVLTSESRVNIIVEDIAQWRDEQVALYDQQLRETATLIEARYADQDPVEVNVLTDLWYLTERCDCGAGETSVAIAPDGRIYTCPAFYFADETDSLGSIGSGLRIGDPRQLAAKSSSYCSDCDIYSCRRCKFLNKKITGELSIPSRIQCRVSYLERAVSCELQQRLLAAGLLQPRTILKPLPYMDSLEVVLSRSHARR